MLQTEEAHRGEVVAMVGEEASSSTELARTGTMRAYQAREASTGPEETPTALAVEVGAEDEVGEALVAEEAA